MSRHANLLEALHNSTSTTDLLRIIRAIKNAMIGNKTTKEYYITNGIIPKLVDIISTEVQGEIELMCKIQAVICIGSLAYAPDTSIAKLVCAAVVGPLLAILNSKDTELVETSLKALRNIVARAQAHKIGVIQQDYIPHLISFVGISAHGYGEIAANILASCCVTLVDQKNFVQNGAIPPLLKLLASGQPKSEEAATSALASLVTDYKDGAEAVLSHSGSPEGTLNILYSLLKDNRSSMRLKASLCLIQLFRTEMIPAQQSNMSLLVLPCLVRLLQDPDPIIQQDVPLAIVLLLTTHEDMQRAAANLDLINKLSTLLQTAIDANQAMPSSIDLLRERVLLAVAAACSEREDCRTSVVESKILSHILAGLTSPVMAIKAASCQCTRSLSRSIAKLRTTLVDAGIVTPLLALLDDSAETVQVAACATICNIVLDFSPMKQAVWDAGGVDKLISLAKNKTGDLRLNGLWAIKNLLYKTDSAVKEKLMKAFGWDTLKSIVDDPDLRIQVQALNILQNLAVDTREDIDMVLRNFGKHELVELIDRKVHIAFFSSNSTRQNPALYLFSNICTGSDDHKALMLSRDSLVKGVIELMSHSRAEVREATAWCVMNAADIAEPNDYPSSHAQMKQRIEYLKRCGVIEHLRNMESDSDADVRHRARDALLIFEAAPVTAPAVASAISTD